MSSLSNSDIADRLMSLAQLLAAQKENPFKVKAYRRAASAIRALPESVDELVRHGISLTKYQGIGKGIDGAVREIVESGRLGKLETLRSEASPELTAISEYPGLDPARTLRVFKKLKIASIAELRQKLESGELGEKLGPRMEQHVRQALTEQREMLLYHADPLAATVQEFLMTACGARKATVVGAWRRRVEVLTELSFLVDVSDFGELVSRLQRYGGRAQLLNASTSAALLRLASGINLRVDAVDSRKWGVALIVSTGSPEHLYELEASGHSLGALISSDVSYAAESEAYSALGLSYIEPELREGRGEVQLAATGSLPNLVSLKDFRGELHAHSTSSDGRNTIEEMAAGAKERGYEYIGITDHSWSLKIAGGVSEEKLRDQIRYIDDLNGKLTGIRVLKSAEVDILADGSLDYPDELLQELDYTVCSIHSRFNLGKTAQTERILRAMDNRYFTILGHATGRRLLKRPGYGVDMERLISYARSVGCFFEINSSPERLDLSADYARLAHEAGVRIAVNTDAHSVRELDLIRCGMDQARRAGLQPAETLNCLPWPELQRVIKR